MHVHNSSEKGIKQGVVSIIVNTLLFVVKFWAGILSGSVALIADAWHTLSDSLSSIVLIAGIKLSGRKPTTSHPFGYGRWEQISAMIIGFMLAIVAYEFLIESIERLRDNASAQYGSLAIIVTITSILVKEGLARYAFWIYRQTGFISLKADGWHHRSDAISSIVVLIGIFLNKYVWWIDAVLGIIISLMLFYVSYEIIQSAVIKLLGEKLPTKLEQDIKDYICSTFGEYDTHHYHIHYYGAHRELTFHLKVQGEESVNNSHQLATQIEMALKDTFHLECTIHIEPKL